MNKIYKLFLAAAATSLLFAGCTKNYEELNTDPYALQKADPAVLLPAMISSLMYVQQNDSQMIDQMVGTLGGYFTLTNRWGGQNFDTFNASDSWNAIPFNTPFEDVYGGYFKVAEVTQNAGHWYAFANLVKAAAMMRVADCYGPIPYSKVQKGLMYVEYDSNEEVYENIINDLKDAVSILYGYSIDPALSATRPLGNSDLVYGGDYAMWAKLGNSYILRAAVRSGNKQAAIDAINNPAGLILKNEQNAMMDPSIQINPYQLAAVSWGDLRANASIVDYMTGYKDPRMSAYFTKCTFGGATDRYVGMRSGSSDFVKTDVQGYSMPNLQPDSKLPVFLAAETYFLMAEAALNGWISDDVQKLYETGITLSMEQYGVSAADIRTYLADAVSVPANHTADPGPVKNEYARKTDVKIAWEAGASDDVKLEKIITQKWIANYQLGIEAWTEYRRTGYPDLCPVIDNLSKGVVSNDARGLRRLRYPYTEKDLNSENYQNAVNRYFGGTDNESVDLFWVKK